MFGQDYPNFLMFWFGQIAQICDGVPPPTLQPPSISKLQDLLPRTSPYSSDKHLPRIGTKEFKQPCHLGEAWIIIYVLAECEESGPPELTWKLDLKICHRTGKKEGKKWSIYIWKCCNLGCRPVRMEYSNHIVIFFPEYLGQVGSPGSDPGVPIWLIIK